MQILKNRRSQAAAVAAGVAILVISGVGYRIAADRLGRVPRSNPLPPDLLADLPLRIGDWVGRDVPLEESLIRATDADGVVNRAYRNTVRGQSVGLFVAYGVRARDLMPHRPEVCYPGTGWTLGDSDAVELTPAAAPPLPCTIYRFSRGGLGERTITVLNYYVIDGRCAPDESHLRSKAWRGQGGVRYVAQVQVTCVGDNAVRPGDAEQAVRDFAAESFPHIRALLPDGSKSSAAASESAAKGDS